MSHRSIFEILREYHDLEKELLKIDQLFSGNDVVYIRGRNKISIEEFVSDRCISFWHYRESATSCAEIREILGIESVGKIRSIDIEQQLQFALTYLEYVINMMHIYNLARGIDTSEERMNQITIDSNISRILEHYNYEKREIDDDDRIIIVAKNPAADRAAELVDDDYKSLKIIEYNHFMLKGNLDKKKEILNTLANHVEPLFAQLISNGYSSLQRDAGFLLNNLSIRHNNLSGKHFKEYTANMDPDTLESWYDKAYDVLLMCILADNYISLSTDMNELKTHY